MCESGQRTPAQPKEEAAVEQMALLEAMDVKVRARCHRECDRESDPSEKGMHLKVVQEAVVG